MAETARSRSKAAGSLPAKRGRRPGGGVREEILRIATRQFAARGLEGTTLQAVADEVGISKPSVLHHFPSKEALHAAVIAGIIEHWQELVPAIMRGMGGPEQPFDILIRELIGFFQADPDRARLLLRETLDRPREFRKIYLDHVHPWLAMFGVQVQDGQKRGTYRSDAAPDVFLRHMLQLIVVSTGTGDVIDDRTGIGARERAEDRYRELLRIARNSLFNDATAPGRPKTGR
jgi:AcrR family transcriptional regulator